MAISSPPVTAITPAAASKRQADDAFGDLREFLAQLRPAFSYRQIAEILNLRSELHAMRGDAAAAKADAERAAAILARRDH